MILDDLHKNKYLIVHDDGRIQRGWIQGWQQTEKYGSPKIDLVPQLPIDNPRVPNMAGPLEIDLLWPDTKDYEQNNPGIIKKATEINDRSFSSDLEKIVYMNILRVPICASYLAACAKVQPHNILELGTGGDSAHSTGIFLFWLDHLPGHLISVDRHYLSHAWLRYRKFPTWSFIQGDSISVMKAIQDGKIESFREGRFDMIFIDSSHTYPHTLKELIQASGMTNAILMDDSTVPEVAKSRDEFLADNQEWIGFDCAHGITLLERHDRIRTP